MKKKSFCENKFRSMLLSGTLTMAVTYIMLLCDNVISGIFIGEKGVAAVNAISPIASIVTFFGSIISIGSAILYSRRIGEMEKQSADKIFGQGLVSSVLIAVVCAVGIFLCRDVYFSVNGVTGKIYELAAAYYRWAPLSAALTIMCNYLLEMVYTDGDETSNTISYILQFGGKIIFSLILVQSHGMAGIIFGTILGNVLGLIPVIWHFFRKSNTLHFVWHFSFRDMWDCVRFSAVDASIYLCWAVADYVLISFCASHYGDDGLVTLAVIFSLIEVSILLDGVGMAIQPLLGTYLSEKNHYLIRRLMKFAIKTALIIGVAANVLIFVFAEQFCGLFGITGGALLVACARAVRIVSLGLVFCGMVALETSYYLLVDHIGLSVGITVFKDGLLYSVLPILVSFLLGETGLWVAFALSPVLTLILSFLFIRLRYGKKEFPYLLKNTDTEIIVIDDTLTPENCGEISKQVQKAMIERGYSEKTAYKASLFTEEIGLTVIDRNKESRKRLMIEVSLIFDEDAVMLIERDSGDIFDITDPNLKIEGLSSFVLSSLMKIQDDKAYMTTTGYNRNIIRFPKDEAVVV